ncbi:geranylgeranyl pyrophosphate synthetase [Taxawa tesnikishii (nom. ined.)]|nr:geranylgeranyl pyrophosphate synthetase [Dothideales sp. JES 119]
MSLGSDSLPGAIPPRTSSSNAVNGHGPASPRKQSLPALPEEDWIASTHRKSHTSVYGPPLSSPTDSLSNALPHLSSPLSPLRPIGNDLIHEQQATWSQEKEKILLGPFEYMFGHPGKDIRSEMIRAFNAWLSVPEASLSIITKVVGMLHTASLLVDDVEDNSLLRRGVPVAHNIFGTAQTINSANYVYFCALQELLKLNNPAAISIYTEELLNLHRGQGMDLFWRDTLTCPSEDDYLEMVGNKTGGLFRLAVKLMQCESVSSMDCVPLVNTIGLLFQILDDYKNLSDSVYTANKGLCEDLTEGKFSFPVIHSIRTDPSNLVLINILKQKTKDEEVKRYAVSYMERMGSFSYTRKVLRGLTRKALALVDELDAGRDKGDAIRLILEKMKVDKGTHQRTTSTS